MNRIEILKNKIQEYAWGSRSFIPELMGLPTPSKTPQAEMWLGAHPKASSVIITNNVQKSLNELIKDDPEGLLGRSVAAKFSNNLPFLLKVIAASSPLSIQAHPNKEQARQGIMREDQDKIPFDSPFRNYKDQNHKPELICALTQFWALKGFRRKEDIINLMDRVDASSMGMQTELLKNQQAEEGLKRFFASLLTMDKTKQNLVVEKIMGVVEGLDISEPAFQWMKRLYSEYPGDIGVLSPLFLNVIKLKPTEAMYIASGELHCYLEGAGLELMANSDNVIRGGLTPKHVDRKELIDILEFLPEEPKIILPKDIGNNEAVYYTGNDEFRLSVISLRGGDMAGSIYQGSLGQRSAEIILCTAGKAVIKDIEGDALEISRGMSLFIPASIKGYSISGKATLYKATTPV